MEDIYSSSNRDPNRKKDSGSRDISSTSGQRPRRPAPPPNPNPNHRRNRGLRNRGLHKQASRPNGPRRKTGRYHADFTPVRPPAQNPYDRRPPQQQRPPQRAGDGQPMEDIKSGRKKRGRKKHVLLKLFLALIALILVAAIAGGSYLYRLMALSTTMKQGIKITSTSMRATSSAARMSPTSSSWVLYGGMRMKNPVLIR